MVVVNKNVLLLFYMLLMVSINSIECFSLADLLCNVFNWCFNQEQYKLTYFDIRGRAEFIRFMFAACGRVYEDNRITAIGWPSIKEKMPFEQLPILEINKNGEKIVLAQSQAIAKYLAKKFNIGGRNELENAFIDMYGEQLSDLFDDYANANAMSDPYLINETWTRHLKYFETRLVKNASGFLVGSSLTWIDIYLAQIVEFMDEKRDIVLAKYPNVKILVDKVREIPLIVDWIRRRPITDG